MKAAELICINCKNWESEKCWGCGYFGAHHIAFDRIELENEELKTLNEYEPFDAYKQKEIIGNIHDNPELLTTQEPT
jgi:hypothetical protein